ncbi:MAG: hypothetical protein PHX86_07230 [Caldisericia bacterium]|nr:hypothetical protein [Caldisericia bacterium]
MKKIRWISWFLVLCIVVMAGVVFYQQYSIHTYENLLKDDILVVTVYDSAGNLLSVDYAKSKKRNPLKGAGWTQDLRTGEILEIDQKEEERREHEKNITIYTPVFVIDDSGENPVFITPFKESFDITLPTNSVTLKELPDLADVMRNNVKKFLVKKP